jgi:hypothetical protein
MGALSVLRLLLAGPGGAWVGSREFRGMAVTDVRRDTKMSVERLERMERGRRR